MVVPVNYDPSILQPKVPLFLKRRIQRFIDEVSAPDVQVIVKDPVYEEVTFDITLKISAEFDIDSVVDQLNQTIIDHLTPWNNHDENGAVALASKMYLTELAQVLERHIAVEMIHVMRASVNGNTVDGNVIEPSFAGAILVPGSEHKISLVNRHIEVYEGVEKWRVEVDFVVS